MIVSTLFADRFSPRRLGSSKAITMVAMALALQVPHATGAVVFTGQNVENNGSGTATTTFIGFPGAGTATLSDGTTRDLEYHVNLANASSGNGTMNVSGVGSIWNLRGTAGNIIGQGGTGTVNLTDSGQLIATSMLLGFAAGSSGTVNISNEASLTLSSSLTVGRVGNGTLNVRNGGKLNASSIFSAGAVGGTGNINVESNGDVITQFLSIGAGSGRGNAALQILSGGKIHVNATGVSSVMGSFEFANNATALISGAGSQLTGLGNFQIDANSTIVVADGGKVEFNGNITTLASSTTTTTTKITVTGAGSLLSSKGSVVTSERNNASTTELTAVNGGKIRAANSISLSNATLRIGTGADSAPGLIDANVIANRDNRASTVEFNHNADNYAFSNDAGAGVAMTGSLSVKVLAGGTVFTGNHSYTGATTISGGELVVNSSIAASSRTTVQTGGMLSGSGTVGALTLASGGILSPGNSPGTLAAGSTTWQGGGTYLFEINNAQGVAGTNWDVLAVSGDVTFSGTGAFAVDLQSLNSSNGSGALANFDNSENYSWLLLSYTGNVSNFDASRFEVISSDFLNDLEGGSFGVTQQGKGVYLNFTAAVVPEPSAALLVVVGLAGVVMRRRRVHTLSEWVL